LKTLKAMKTLQKFKTFELYDYNKKTYLSGTDYKGREYIILMGMPSSIHILTAALKIKSTDPNRGVKARAVVLKFSTSTWVTIPTGTVTALLAAIAAFNAAIGVAKKSTWNTVNTGLKAVMGTFAAAMGLDPVHAAEICVSGGFYVKGVPIKQKNVYRIFQGSASGIMDCIGDVMNKDCIHQWRLSRDGIVWVMQRATKNAIKQFTGLAPGRWWVEHQCIMDNGDDGTPQVLYLDLI
jgi:hypothetical protein